MTRPATATETTILIKDLALHAAGQAHETLTRVCDAAESPATAMTAYGLALNHLIVAYCRFLIQMKGDNVDHVVDTFLEAIRERVAR